MKLSPLSRRLCILIFALALFVGACVLSGCSKKRGILDEKLLTAAENAPQLDMEIVGRLSADRPTLVVFHGESEENEHFSLTIPTAVYDENVLSRGENDNASTIGFKGRGLVKTADGQAYDLLSYWTDVAKFNVVLLHAEKYFAFDEKECATKVYSAYRSEYKEKGKTVEVNAGYSVAELVAALTVKTLATIGTKEIRFVGYGTGSNLALQVASYLFTAHEKGKNTVLPSRVTLCDPYLNTENCTYSVSWSGEDMAGGAAQAVARDATYLDEKGVAIEWIATEEVGAENRFYAYGAAPGDETDALRRVSASLTYSETYSLHASFREYKKKRRVAFDWYMYSIIGSDDSKDYGYESQKYAIGYPHSISELYTNSGTSIVNWAYDIYGDARRPILNDRAKTNDASSSAGAKYGKNFAVSAWTPTNYIRGLRGVSFRQKEGSKVEGTADVFGNDVYEYFDRPSECFRSENYQYSDLNQRTVFSGCVYYDADGNGVMDDGVSGLSTYVYLTVTKNNGDVLVPRTKIQTDDNGRYTVVFHDASDENEAFSFVMTDHGVECNGYSLVSTEDGFVFVSTELYTPKGYTARGEEATGYWYETSQKNNASNGQGKVEISPYTVHSVVLYNTLIRKEEAK